MKDLRNANLPTAPRISDESSSIVRTSAPLRLSAVVDENKDVEPKDIFSPESILCDHDDDLLTQTLTTQISGKAELTSTPSARGSRRVSDTAAMTPPPPIHATLSPMSTGSSYSPGKWKPSADRVVCPACQRTVYFAEQTKAVGKTWHKACLRCSECKTILDSSRLVEKEGVPVCGNCYAKKYGPLGSGYGLAGRR